MNHLLPADNSHQMSSLILNKNEVLKSLLSAAVVIGALKVTYQVMTQKVLRTTVANSEGLNQTAFLRAV